MEEISVSTIINVQNTPENFHGGQIAKYFDNWHDITSDEWILQTVQGYEIEMNSIPNQTFVPTPILFNDLERDMIDAEMQAFLNKQIVEEVEFSQYEQFYSNIFIRPKKDESVRVILNLKQFNESVHKIHFKMETLKSAIAIIQPNDYFASIDLKDAYFSVLVNQKDRKYLRFIWEGKHYQFRTLPQGLSCSPRVFTKLLKPAFACLRSMGHSSVPYIDDSLLRAKTKEQCQANVSDTTRLMDRLGFTVHPKKSVFNPVQIIVFLGFVLNSITMRVMVTEERIGKLIMLGTTIISRKIVTIREFAQLLGKMVACEPGMQYAPLYYKDLEHEKDQKLKQCKGNYDAHIVISDNSREMISAFLEYSKTAYKPITRKDPTLTLYSDSSKTGWGGVNVTHNTHTNGLWSEQEKLEHINILELKAALLTIKALAAEMQNAHIQIFMDNTVAISYVNKFGGKMSALHSIAKEIWCWAKDRNLWISAVHVPGVENNEADDLSRKTNDDTEWMLNPIYFQSLKAVVGDMDIDMFASRINCQLPQYVSYTPDAQAIAVDAMSLLWTDINKVYYLFPPFSIISRCIQKIVKDRVETAILIAPLWPTQVWFSVILQQTCAQSYILPANRVVIMPTDKNRNHPVRKLKLAAFVLSGNTSKVQDYHETLSTSFYNPGESPQFFNMGHISENGCHFVTDKKLICLKHLPQQF